MSRKASAVPDAREVSSRLKSFAARRYGSWEQFYKKVGIPRTTAAAWARRTNPRIPDGTQLMNLASKSNLNLNWLLLGQGHDLWEYPGRSANEILENRIEAELRNRGDCSSEEFQAAWDRIVHYRGDFSRTENVLLGLAVEGVRPRFEENLRLVRHYAGVMTVLNGHVQGLSTRGPDGAKLANDFGLALRKAMQADPADL